MINLQSQVTKIDSALILLVLLEKEIILLCNPFCGSAGSVAFHFVE